MFAAAVVAASAVVVVAPDGAFARFGGGGGGHGFGAHHAVGPFHARARLPLLRRRFAPLWYPPYDDWSGYGGFDTATVVPGNGGPVTILRTMIEQPPCQVQFETRTVPAEAGGTRSIAVTKCALRPTGQAGAYNAVAERADDPKLATGGLGEDKPIDAQGCRADIRTMPAEGGGERKVTITRC
jgi:hypothetical protein